jgi:hypothetical protein
MTKDAVRPSQGWFALRIAALPAFLYCAVRFLHAFCVYSFQAGGLYGSSAHRGGYDVARAGQWLTLAAFVACQLIAGVLLRSLIGSKSADIGSRVRGVLLCSLGFFLLTGLVAWVLTLASATSVARRPRVSWRDEMANVTKLVSRNFMIFGARPLGTMFVYGCDGSRRSTTPTSRRGPRTLGLR